MKRITFLTILITSLLMLMDGVAVATFTTIDDSWNGANTYWGGSSRSDGGATDRDIIGDWDKFGIKKMTVETGGGWMTVKVIGPYFSYITTHPSDPYPLDMRPGDLFIDLQGWNPYGTDAHHKKDSMLKNGVGGRPLQPWDLAFDLQDIKDGALDEAGALYYVADGSIDPSGPPGGTFRHNQEWQFDPLGSNPITDGTGEWEIAGDTLTMTFPITNEIFFNVKEIGLHWTMECANDVVAGSAPIGIPEPSTIVLLGAGLLGLAFFARRR